MYKFLSLKFPVLYEQKLFFIILEEYTVSNILGTNRITGITGDYNKHICVHVCVCREIEKERQRGRQT